MFPGAISHSSCYPAGSVGQGRDWGIACQRGRPVEPPMAGEVMMADTARPSRDPGDLAVISAWLPSDLGVSIAGV